MNATASSVLPLTAIALCLTPKQWFDMLGFEWSMEILQAQRQARSRREAILDMIDTPWFYPTPIGYDSMGAPLYPHQLPA